MHRCNLNLALWHSSLSELLGNPESHPAQIRYLHIEKARRLKVCSFSYFIGCAFGKHKFCSVSPKKSWEGAIGGFLGSVAVVILFGVYVLHLSILQAGVLGLVVDKGISLCDLKGMLDEFVKKIFGQEIKTRLRPSYFPFTEPSVEVDVSCFQCGGKGCKLCKGTGWIEVLGAGIVNKKVLENCGIDSDKYSGFAFGLGLERIAMLKYGINNIKMLFESDLRVLDQIDD